jgi:hypothetical protein
MKKRLHNDEAFYDIAWSTFYKYEKYSASKILPELAGIVSLHEYKRNSYTNLIFYGCWRDGCRIGLKKFIDMENPDYKHIVEDLDLDNLYFRYTIVDTSPSDLKDILFWLIATYNPPHNNKKTFSDSKRYKNINVRESTMQKDAVIERIR